MTVIAMTREMGSLGKDVALAVAQKLDLDIVHKEVVESHLVRRTHLGESEVHRFLEGEDSLMERWTSDKRRLSFATTEEILELASHGNVLIRGWGAARILCSIPHVLCVRVCAPMEQRINEMMLRLGISRERAKREIERSDVSHERTMIRLFDTDWRDPLNYDLVVNTEHVPVDVGADLIIQAAAAPSFASTEASENTLKDKLIEACIRRSLVENGLARDAKHIYASVHSGVVRLYGSVHGNDVAHSLESVVCDVDGVRDVRNEIVDANNFTAS